MITPVESVILNVLSASVDLSTCESIRMSQKVDKTGERTLAAVTIVDEIPEGPLEKVKADNANIGLGYVCVRNRVGDESYADARVQEAMLFGTHPLLSKISKTMVGIPVLAQKLVQIQAAIISKCLPGIVRKINEKLAANMAELQKLPQSLSSVPEAVTTFMRVMSSAKDTLKKIFIRGEFDDYPDKKEMHCTARLAEMLNQFSDKLPSINVSTKSRKNFFLEEIGILEETKGITLPNFLPRSAFLSSLQKKVKSISSTPVELVDKLWNYIEKVLVRVLTNHSENY